MAKAAILIKPVAAIICDDVRRETNNKDILIGVYSGDLILNRSPIRLKLCIYLLIELLGAGTTEFELKLTGPDGDSENVMKGALEGLQPTAFNHRIGLTFAPFHIRMSKKGELLAKFRLQGQRWKTVATVPVQLSDTAISPSPERSQPA